MPDWLMPKSSEVPPTWDHLAGRIGCALVAGVFVALLHRLVASGARKDTKGLPLTLVLLAGLVAVGTLVIGENTARAFGLVGALSIVRFRTVVEDTSDTAFVIFSVTIGMGLGAGYYLLAIVAFPLLSIAAIAVAWVTRPKLDRGIPYTLRFRLALGLDPEVILLPKLREFAGEVELASLESGSKGTALDFAYRMRLNDAKQVAMLLAELAKIEGVQSLELKA